MWLDKIVKWLTKNVSKHMIIVIKTIETNLPAIFLYLLFKVFMAKSTIYSDWGMGYGSCLSSL